MSPKKKIFLAAAVILFAMGILLLLKSIGWQKEDLQTVPDAPLVDFEPGEVEYFARTDTQDGKELEWEDLTPENFIDEYAMPAASTSLTKDEVNGEWSEKTIGRITIKYRTADADAATGETKLSESIKADVDTLIFDDGVGGKSSVAVTGTTIPMFEEALPTTMEEAVNFLDIQAPSGSGVIAGYTESEDYYIGVVAGYDYGESTTYVSYSFLSKKDNKDCTIYSLTYFMYGDNEAGVAPKEESFNSVAEAFKPLAGDSEDFVTDYNELCDTLRNIHFYKTATGETVGNLTGLRAARAKYLWEAYGVDVDGTHDPNAPKSLNELSREERERRYFMYVDPIGYEQTIKHQEKVERLEKEAEELQKAAEQKSEKTAETDQENNKEAVQEEIGEIVTNP